MKTCLGCLAILIATPIIVAVSGFLVVCAVIIALSNIN